jgi:adenosylmethionine-8-amino-7-oxononanoate aminotransferase
METWAKHAPASGESPYASTFYAHPLACAGALVALKALTAAPAPDPARTFAEDLRAHVRESPCAWAVRGVGSMAAIELSEPAADPVKRNAGALAGALAANGVLAVPGGRSGRALVFLPARSLTAAQRAEAFARLSQSLKT